jgi:hypothetical protein
MGCGISAQDFEVVRANKLTGKAMTDFEKAVQASGARYKKPLFFEREQETVQEGTTVSGPAWPPVPGPEAVEIACPNCGQHVRQGYYPLVNIRCCSCWTTVFSQDSTDVQSEIVTPPGLVCSCGELVVKQPGTELDPGTVYLCPGCEKWLCQPGDREAEKRLRKWIKSEEERTEAKHQESPFVSMNQ